MTKLKPCPFCGGEAKLKTARKSDGQISMEGIYSTCINQSTLDEAPFAYKNWEEIARLIEPTVKINERIIPIYNFKASES